MLSNSDSKTYMKISILTVFDELYSSFLQTSLIRRAQEQNEVCFDVKKFTDFVPPKERIDAPTSGPGAGMIIRPEVVEKAVDCQERKNGIAYKIFFSPKGKRLDQRLLQDIVTDIRTQKRDHLMLIAARYEGMDARVEEQYADRIISIGDFVLMGGDLPAMLFLESFLRLIPGIVGKHESVEHDSFYGAFVDYPEYCLPVFWKSKEMPEIIRSGNHGAIREWRQEKAAQMSVLHHFEWLRAAKLTSQEKALAAKYVPPHYVVLLHSDVLIGPEKAVGTTSVTSLDIHDIARSARTYGLQGFFIVTPLLDQQKIVQQLLDFWKEGHGITYNPSRHEAVNHVEIKNSLDDVIQTITKMHGSEPLLVATSAVESEHQGLISFYDQEKVWSQTRPVILLLGTGRGIAASVIQRSNFLLVPVEGFSVYNHLSVRSAAAIIFDRWLGINQKTIVR